MLKWKIWSVTQSKGEFEITWTDLMYKAICVCQQKYSCVYSGEQNPAYAWWLLPWIRARSTAVASCQQPLPPAFRDVGDGIQRWRDSKAEHFSTIPKYHPTRMDRKCTQVPKTWWAPTIFPARLIFATMAMSFFNKHYRLFSRSSRHIHIGISSASAPQIDSPPPQFPQNESAYGLRSPPAWSQLPRTFHSLLVRR